MNQALEDFCSSLQGKTVAVVGVGVSNAPLCELFWENGARVTACDRRERAELGEIADSLEAKGIELKLGGDYLKGLTQELIIKTPGMRPDLPERDWDPYGDEPDGYAPRDRRQHPTRRR